MCSNVNRSLGPYWIQEMFVASMVLIALAGIPPTTEVSGGRFRAIDFRSWTCARGSSRGYCSIASGVVSF